MSFFENIFTKAKKIVSDGKETIRDWVPSSKVSYTAPKKDAPVYASTKYAKDPLMDLIKTKPKVPQAQWGVAVREPEPISMKTAESTQAIPDRDPVSTIEGIIEGGKVAVKTAPVIAKEVAQGSMRAYAGLGGLITGQELTPRGKFQESLYGTKDKINVRTVGEEIVPKGSKFAPAVGFAMGALDLVGGGRAVKGIKTLDELAQVRKDLSVIDTTRKAGKSKILSVNTDALLGEDITGYGDLDLKTVAEYKAKIEKGEPIDPLIVQVKDGNVYVEDGKHRLAALRELGIESVDVVEKPIYKSTAKKGTAMDIKPVEKPVLRDGQPPVGTEMIRKDGEFVPTTDVVARERYDIPNLKKVSFGGSDRDVYDLGDNRVIKIVKTSRGLDQNQYSRDWYAEDQGLIPRTLEMGRNYVVKEKVGVPDANTKKMISELKQLDTTALVGKVGGWEKHDAEMRKAVEIMTKYGYPGDELANYGDILWGDMTAIRNWGTKDGKPILLDEGTLNGNLVLNNSNKRGSGLAQDPEFRDIYNKSRTAKKAFGDGDSKTMYSGAVGGVEEDEEGNLSIDPLKAALGIAGVGALQKSGAITKIDQLIAAGKVRVVSRDGRDVYQIKKGDTWVSKRDEDSTLKAFEEKPKAPRKDRDADLPEELQQRIIANDIAREALDADPAKQLSKYVAKRGEFKGGLAEEIKSKTGFGLDVRAMDLGYENTEEARKAYDLYRTRKADLEAETSQIKFETRLARKQAKEGSIADSLPKKAPRVAPSQVKSLEESAQKTLQEIDLPPPKRPLSLEEIVTRTPLSKKVNLLDYIRTPDRVLAKIGFAKEARLLRNQYEEYVKELPKNLDRVTEWFNQVPKESNVRLFQYLDGKDIKLSAQEQKVAGEIKAYLKEWADRLKLPEDNRIAHYITHIFDDQLIAKEFDEDLAKLIDEKVPGQVYDPFLEKRLGAKGYKEDVWAALDAYTKRATRKVHMDVALEKIRDKAGSSLEFSNLEKSQFKYIQNYIDRVNMRPTEIDTMIDTAFKQLFGYRLGQRPVLRIMQALRRMTYRGMLGLNLGSALRNLSQGVNTYATLGEKYTAIGYAKLFNSKAREELKREGVFSNTFIQDRSINATKKAVETLDKGLWVFFDAAEKINRGSAYFGAKAKGLAQGMNETEAIEYAKSLVRKTQFSYDAVDTPLALQPDILKTLFQFQTFTTKQTEFMAELIKDRNFAALVRYAIGGMAFVYTIGQAMGMEPKDLLPVYRLDTPPSLKFPWELTKAVADAPDKYGNDRDLETKAKDVGKSAIGLFPAGVQIKKTIEGTQTVNEGGSFDKAGRLQFLQGQSVPEKAQSIAFGKYSSDESDQYFDKEEDKAKALESIKPTYEKVQELKTAGKLAEAQIIVDSLSEDEYSNYKAYKSQVTKEQNAELKKSMVPRYLEVQELKKSGNTAEAQALVDAMSDDEYKAYEAIKKDAEKIEITAKERNAIETIGAYAKAFFVDPGNASKALFTNEKLGRVEGNLVELKRFYGRDYKAVDGSEAYIYEQLKAMGIDAKERSNYNLEHIVPVSAGGDSSPENLRVVDRPTHESWTEFDIMLGNAVKSKKINRKRAEKIARDYKNGVISFDEAKGMIE